MELSKEEFIRGIRGQTQMSLYESYRLAIEWAKKNCLTMKKQYEFLLELYTEQQINMLMEMDV